MDNEPETNSAEARPLGEARQTVDTSGTLAETDYTAAKEPDGAEGAVEVGSYQSLEDLTGWLRHNDGDTRLSKIEDWADEVRAAETPPKQSLPESENWLRGFKTARTAIVCGGMQAEQVALSLALQLGLDRCWTSNWYRKGALTYEGIIHQLQTRSGSNCLVIWIPERQIDQSVVNLGRAVAEAARRGYDYGLIIWTRGAVLQALTTRGEAPENIPVFQVPDTRDAGGNTSSDLDLLFSSGGTTLAEALRFSEERLIPRTLVRLAVLFGSLPSTEFDRLACAALRGKQVRLDRDNDPNPREEDAALLWERLRDFFLNQAGLVRKVGFSPQRIGFSSDSQEEAAHDHVWRDVDEMTEVFLSAKDDSAFFGQDETVTNRASFDGYLNAVITLARRSPHVFGSRWLRDVIAGWVSHSTSGTPDELQGTLDLLGLLKLLKKHAEAQEQRHESAVRFAERLGPLCRALLEDANTSHTVTELLSQLRTSGLLTEMWHLVMSLRGVPGFAAGDWARSYLATRCDESLQQPAPPSSDDRENSKKHHAPRKASKALGEIENAIAAETVPHAKNVKEVAEDLANCARESASELFYWAKETMGWLPEGVTNGTRKSSEAAAFLFPAVVFNMAALDDRPSHFADAFDADFDCGGRRASLGDHWQRFCGSEEFGLRADRYFQPNGTRKKDGDPARGIALTLLFAMRTAQKDDSATLTDWSAGLMRCLTTEHRRRLKIILRELSHELAIAATASRRNRPNASRGDSRGGEAPDELTAFSIAAKTVASL